MVKVKKTRRGDTYIIPELPEAGLHISLHRSGLAHIKDKEGRREIFSTIRRTYVEYLVSKLTQQRYEDVLIGRPCEIYPDCICIDLALNPGLIESGEYGKLCYTLQKHFGGGLCPRYRWVLCMWSFFAGEELIRPPMRKVLEKVGLGKNIIVMKRAD